MYFKTRQDANSYKRIQSKWYDKVHRVVKVYRRRMNWQTAESYVETAPSYILQLKASAPRYF